MNKKKKIGLPIFPYFTVASITDSGKNICFVFLRAKAPNAGRLVDGGGGLNFKNIKENDQ